MTRSGSISRRYAVWYSALSLAVLVAAMLTILVMSWKGSEVLRDNVEKSARTNYHQVYYSVLRNLAEYLRQHLAPFLYQLDIHQINVVINDLRKGMPIESFVITDPSGMVLTDGTDENESYGRHVRLDMEGLAASPVLIERTGNRYRVTFQIGLAGYRIGYGEIFFGDALLRKAVAEQDEAIVRVWHGFERTFLTIAAVGIIASAIISVIMSLIISRNISLPLVRLRDATGKVASGDLEHRVETRSKDEIGELAQSFNTMVDNLRKRTEELADINRSLQVEIQERAKAERELAAEKERLGVTLQSIGDGVVATDVEGTLLLMNAVAEELTGWSREEAAGKPVAEIVHLIDEETRAPVENLFDHAIRSGRISDTTTSTALVDRSGRERIVIHSCAPIRDNDKKVIGTVLVFSDVTEKRRIERESQKAGKLESLGILAGGIAHDFNNLLTGILGNISLARRHIPQASKTDERLEAAERAATRAGDLTKQLLTFSKGGAPVKRIVRIGDLIKESANFALRGSNVRCDFSIDDELWNADVDEGQLTQVINNLVINADQAMPDGGLLTVRAANLIVTPELGLPLTAGPYVTISVRDRGVGISKEDLSRIFDPYFTTKKTGEGLGLATTYSIIKNHDGFITVNSEPGAGAEFTIYLPASPAQGVSVGPERREMPHAGKGRVLVMDDEKAIREVVCQILAEFGYETVEAADGGEAIALYADARQEGRPFDVVIMDLTIPGGMGGMEALQRLRAIDPNVKAIVSSGYSNNPIMASFREHGFIDVIAKPYSADRLGEVLQRIVLHDGES